MASIRCGECRRAFEPDRDQRAFLASAAKRGMSFVMLGCPSCRLSFAWNPQSASAPRARKAVQYACPAAGCDGIVCRVNDAGKYVWGFGECGRTWAKSKLTRRA